MDDTNSKRRIRKKHQFIYNIIIENNARSPIFLVIQKNINSRGKKIERSRAHFQSCAHLKTIKFQYI